MKHCGCCKIWKKEIEFSKDKSASDGLDRVCRKCRSKKAKIYRKKHPEKIKAINRKNYLKNRVARIEYSRKYGYELHLNRIYNISLETYDQMFKDQNGNCAICGLPQLMKRLAVDHDHKTGKIRGLLCTNCNTKLRVIEDNEFVEKAEIYLKATVKL